jgi:Cohesin domain
MLLGMAVSLQAQLLSFGEMTLGGNAQTRILNVVLTSQGAQVAGVQFDIGYDPTQLTVVAALGSSAIAASKELSTTTLPAAYNPIPSGTLLTSGQRVIITGVGLSDLSVAATAANVIADGVVATLTLTIAANASTTGQGVTLANVAATTPGGSNISAASLPLIVGAGSNANNGPVNLYTSYLVGDVYPFTGNVAPGFGDYTLNVLDLIQELFGVTGLSAPPACTDRFDAMDTYPVDTATTRGGDGVLNILDLIEELFRDTNLDQTRPVRTSSGGVCIAGQTTGKAVRTSPSAARAPLEMQGTLVLGPAEGSGTAQDQVPVYLQAGRDLIRVALAFGLGDQQSQLRFQAAPGITPSLVEDKQTGIVAAAWLEGLNVRAGQRLLLGYIVGPSGSAANLKVFGVSAGGLNDRSEVGLEVSGAALVQR